MQQDLIINKEMLSYMQKIFKSKVITDKIKNELFDPNELKIVNDSVHNGNFYMLDKYGLVIRKNFQNSKKNAFGWKYNDDNEPVNIHIGELLLQTNSNQIREITLQQLKHQYPNLFKPPRGVIYKIYSKLFPEIDLEKI